MSVTVADVESRVEDLAPQFEGHPLLAKYCASALRRHTESAWETADVYTEGMALWVAHHLTLYDLRSSVPGIEGAIGPISSIRTGDESLAFQAYGSVSSGVQGDVFFFKTSYGQAYISLRNTRPSAHLFVI